MLALRGTSGLRTFIMVLFIGKCESRRFRSHNSRPRVKNVFAGLYDHVKSVLVPEASLLTSLIMKKLAGRSIK